MDKPSHMTPQSTADAIVHAVGSVAINCIPPLETWQPEQLTGIGQMNVMPDINDDMLAVTIGALFAIARAARMAPEHLMMVIAQRVDAALVQPNPMLNALYANGLQYAARFVVERHNEAIRAGTASTAQQTEGKN